MFFVALPRDERDEGRLRGCQSPPHIGAVDGWLWHYTHQRPHSALVHQPPITRTNLLGSDTYSAGATRTGSTIGTVARRRKRINSLRTAGTRKMQTGT